MKLCPLFESIDYSPVPLGTSGIWFTAGVKAANAKLPREAIVAAIEALRTSPTSHWRRHEQYREQLRAMLPEEE
jgi:uncharacterized protein YjiS (DUF1127 family)